jgi:hypothetical protein
VEKDCQPGSPFLFGIENPATSKAPHPAPHRKGGAHDEAPAKTRPADAPPPKDGQPSSRGSPQHFTQPSTNVVELVNTRRHFIQSHLPIRTPKKTDSFPKFHPNRPPKDRDQGQVRAVSDPSRIPAQLPSISHELFNPRQGIRSNTSA